MSSFFLLVVLFSKVLTKFGKKSFIVDCFLLDKQSKIKVRYTSDWHFRILAFEHSFVDLIIDINFHPFRRSAPFMKSLKDFIFITPFVVALPCRKAWKILYLFFLHVTSIFSGTSNNCPTSLLVLHFPSSNKPLYLSSRFCSFSSPSYQIPGRLIQALKKILFASKIKTFEKINENSKGRSMGDMVTWVTSYELLVENLKARVEIQKCELKSPSNELKSTSYEFKSTSSRIIKWMEIHVNSFLKQPSKTHFLKS